MMPDLRTIQLAIKYASQKGDIVVAERLNDLAQMKATEEEKELEQQEQMGARRPSIDCGIAKRLAGRSEDVDHGDSMSQEDRCIALKPAKIMLVLKVWEYLCVSLVIIFANNINR